MAPTDEKFFWNYRVIEHDTDNPVTFGIHSVHYEGGEISGYTADPVEALGNSQQDLRGDLELMMKAFELPVLSLRDLKAKLGE